MTAIRGRRRHHRSGKRHRPRAGDRACGRGCDLALADRDEAGLQTLAAEIAKRIQRKSHACIASTSASPAQIAEFAQAATAAHPALDIVVNNAGVALMGQFERDRPGADGLAVRHQFLGRGACHARLPAASARQRARRTSSTSPRSSASSRRPARSAYAAAKFAVRGFSESVRHELAAAGSPVRLSVVHPGGVATDIVRNSRTGVGVTDNARRAQSIERFDSMRQDHAGGRCAAHHQGHREKRAAHPDRQRRPLMDLLQRFRPATYWAPLQRKLERMAKGTAAPGQGPRHCLRSSLRGA